MRPHPFVHHALSPPHAPHACQADYCGFLAYISYANRPTGQLPFGDAVEEHSMLQMLVGKGLANVVLSVVTMRWPRYGARAIYRSVHSAVDQQQKGLGLRPGLHYGHLRIITEGVLELI
jgi:hypothetical protein